MVVSGDRLLWVWTAVPLAMLAIPTVKNAHYAIAAQVPWSIWAALALARIGERLRRRSWNRSMLQAAAWGGFGSLALVYGTCLWLVAPRLDRRGVEWSFYESIGRVLPSTTSLTLLYDDWDRVAYECAIGSVPHDLAVRLFYLGRPACWHQGAPSLFDRDHAACRQACAPLKSSSAPCAAELEEPDFLVVGRDRDLPELERLGRVEIIARGPTVREDRSYALFRISPNPEDNRLSRQASSRAIH